MNLGFIGLITLYQKYLVDRYFVFYTSPDFFRGFVFLFMILKRIFSSCDRFVKLLLSGLFTTNKVLIFRTKQ